MARTVKERCLRRLKDCTRGNTLMLTALSMPMLIGGLGLSVDVAQWYLWSRELQYATDQAALSGAYSLSKNQNGNWRDRAAKELGANEQVVTFTGTPNIYRANFAGGTNNSVVVQVSASRRLPFSGIFLDSPATIYASSQATFKQATNYTSCIVATNEHDSGAITLGGSATVSVSCGIAALSDSPTAITVNGNPDIDAGYFVTAGGVDDWIKQNTDDEIFEHVEGLTNPFKDLTPPDNSTPRTYACTTSGKGSNKVTTANLLPGTYSSIDTKCNTQLASGIYVINGGNLKINAQYTFTGTSVMFVLKNGASITLNGGANISLTAPTEADLAGFGITDKRLAGMLVFEDPNSPGSDTSKINGNSYTTLNGKIYLPKSNVELLGTATVTSQCLMVVADKITVSGNGTLGSFCPTDTDHSIAIGGGSGRVYLVS